MKKKWTTLASIGCSILVLTLGTRTSFAQSESITASDIAILDMAQAYAQKNQSVLNNLLPKTKDNPLEAWAAYWQLSNRLGSASNDEIDSFLRQYEGSYQAYLLRTTWLKLLGHRQEWRTFLKTQQNGNYQKTDQELVCYTDLANYALNRDDISQNVESTWINLKQLNEGCMTAVNTLSRSGRIPVSIIWKKAREGMEIGNLSMAKNAVSLISDSFIPMVERIYNAPEKFLTGRFIALSPKTRELTILALARLSSTDYKLAENYMTKLRWRVQLQSTDQAWLWGAIGKRATQNFDPKALTYYEHDELKHIAKEHLTWMVRAALLANKSTTVLRAIDAMPNDMKTRPEWVYWRAMAIESMRPKNDKVIDKLIDERADKLLKTIANTSDYYGLLALQALGIPVTEPEQPPPPTPEEMRKAEQNKNLKQSLYALSLGMRTEATKAWIFATNFTTDGMTDRELLAAAKLACQKEFWDRCINTSELTKSFIDMGTRYPTPFESSIVPRSSEINLNPAFVYGLIRQESRFIIAARSVVGAQGLMQVMPATAKWTARKLGMTDFNPSQMSDKHTNIAIGTGYLKLALNSLEGSYPLAAAAYNAGPRRPVSWLNAINNPHLSGAVWVECIPFSETRDYVKKVIANTINYAMVIDKSPPLNIQTILDSIKPLTPKEQSMALGLP